MPRNILTMEGIMKSYGERKLFDGADFYLQEGDKVGVVGINGTGKTTLLRMIAGNESITSGTITLGTNVEIGYYDQEHGILHDEKHTIFLSIQIIWP